MKIGTLAISLAAILASACGGGSTTTSGSSPSPSGLTVNATLAEFTIALDKTTIKAGDVTFNVSNTGSMLHELIVIKTDLAIDQLPMDPADPTRVDESGSVGEVSDVPAGQSKSNVIPLTAGRYVLICNKPGHYKSGQRVEFTVTP